MTSLSWKLNRLRTMSPMEVGHRFFTLAKIKVEKSTIQKLSARRPAEPVSTRFLLIDPKKDELKQKFTLDESERRLVDELVAGALGFFGDTALQVGASPNWLVDPSTGKESPLVFHADVDYRDEKIVGNIKVLWELNRHQHLVPLAVAYLATGDPRYRNVIKEHIASWIDQNPVGMGVNWTSSLESALRLIAWSIVHSLLVARDSDEGLFDLLGAEKIGSSIYHQARHIESHLSRYSSANNHLIGELVGLFVACSLFDLGDEGRKWAEKARLELETEAAKQVFDDGASKEQASYYHVSVLEYLMLAWMIGRRAGSSFSPDFVGRLRAMTRFVRLMTPVGGKLPQIGDSDDGFVTRFTLSNQLDCVEDVIEAVERCLTRKAVETPVDCRQKSFWFELMSGADVETEHKGGSEERKNVRPVIFEDGGYAILGNDRIHVVFDAGPLGYSGIAAHGHADALSFCMALDGNWWIVDPGTYIYHREPEWRNYFRGTNAHSTVVIDGENQSQIAGPFMWLRKADARFSASGIDEAGRQIAVGEHDGYQNKGIICRRKIAYSPSDKRIELTDNLDMGSVHRVAMNFHFHPDVTVTKIQKGEFEAIHGSDISNRLNIQLDPSIDWTVVSGQTKPILGWYSSKLGTKRASPTLHGELTTNGGCSIRSSFAIDHG